MADKEATVYIIDLGRSMGRKNAGRDDSDLEWAMKYVWDKITTTVRLACSKPMETLLVCSRPCQVASGRKTATAGVLGFRTDGITKKLRLIDPRPFR